MQFSWELYKLLSPFLLIYNINHTSHCPSNFNTISTLTTSTTPPYWFSLLFQFQSQKLLYLERLVVCLDYSSIQLNSHSIPSIIYVILNRFSNTSLLVRLSWSFSCKIVIATWACGGTNFFLCVLLQVRGH